MFSVAFVALSNEDRGGCSSRPNRLDNLNRSTKGASLEALLDLDGTDELLARSRTVSAGIEAALADESLRALFRASEVAQRIHRRR